MKLGPPNYVRRSWRAGDFTGSILLSMNVSFSLFLFCFSFFPFLDSFLYTLIVHQVPTLFDTKLTVHDFREFIAQLEESRGSSLTRPNAIGRILNHKACRGMHLSSHSSSPSLVPSLSFLPSSSFFLFYLSMIFRCCDVWRPAVTRRMWCAD